MPHATFTSYHHLLQHLDELGQFRMNPTLERIQQALQRLPAPKGRVVRVTGTNGKGSIARFLQAAARGHGLSTGLFLSPHLTDVRERILLNGRKLPESRWLELANEVAARCGDVPLTYFELLLAMAWLAFAEADADLVILEAGLGGTWDATCALSPDLAVFAPVGLDHQHVLGGTLAEIARDKAGALPPEGLALSAGQKPQVLDVLRRRAGERETMLHGPCSRLMRRAQTELRGLQLRARGDFQRRNAATAWAALKLLAPGLGVRPDLPAARRAMAAAVVPGRMQTVRPWPDGPDLLLDAAHNVPALEALHRALDAEGLRPAALIFTCLADKDLAAMAPLAGVLTQGPIYVPELQMAERTRPATEVAGALGPRALPVKGMEAALMACRLTFSATPSEPVLACGSLFLLAELFTKFPAFLEQDGSIS
jgi:dihydrofolate synthase/folylpolyglutamate synthase